MEQIRYGGIRLSRRQILESSCLGFGSIVLADLLGSHPLSAEGKLPQEIPIYKDLKPRKPHFQPQAKAVIQLVQNGGPSQMDLFDPKPELAKRAGQPLPRRTRRALTGMLTHRLPVLVPVVCSRSPARRWHR